jgi:DNA repair protein RadC
MSIKIYDGTIKWTLRETVEETTIACTPEAVVQYMKGAFDAHPEQEQFWVLFLNRKNAIKGRMMITLGTLNSTLVAPREVFRAAVLASAAAIIVVHNHPNGDPSPSHADVSITRALREAGIVMDIEITDHVIFGEASADPRGVGYYSFRGAGIL